MGTKKITLGATGDILLHKRVYEKARTENGGYNFDSMFENVEHLFDEDHLIIVNQESIIAGEQLGLSGFPKFNSPIEIGYKLKDLNVDIVNISNNHTFDYGEKGILKSIENWNKIGIPYVGAYNSNEDQETLRVFHKNGIRICFMSFNYTEGIKIPKIPEGKNYLMNYYLSYSFNNRKNRLAIRSLIDKAKKKNIADVFVINMHYGKEYHMMPTSKQKEVSQDLAEVGADIIIGHHPHVVQPFEYITNSYGEKCFVAYSLGNFFSGQNGLYRQIGGYLTIDIEYEEESQFVRINNPTFQLTFVDSSDQKDYKIHLLKDMVDSQKVIKIKNKEFNLNEVYNRMIQHVSQREPNIQVK